MLHVLYGRKSARHNWFMVACDTSMDRIEFLRSCWLRDCNYSQWTEQQNTVRTFDSMDRDALPNNVKHLPTQS